MSTIIRFLYILIYVDFRIYLYTTDTFSLENVLLNFHERFCGMLEYKFRFKIFNWKIMKFQELVLGSLCCSMSQIPYFVALHGHNFNHNGVRLLSTIYVPRFVSFHVKNMVLDAVRFWCNFLYEFSPFLSFFSLLSKWPRQLHGGLWWVDGRLRVIISMTFNLKSFSPTDFNVLLGDPRYVFL